MTPTQLSVFRGRLVRAAGISLLTGPVFFACTQQVVVTDDGSGGATSSSSGDATSSNGVTSSSTGSGVGSTGTSMTTGMSSSNVTVGGVGGAGGTMTSAAVTTSGVGGSTMSQVTCFPDQGGPCPDVQSAMNVYGSCTHEEFLYIEEWLAGPFSGEAGECCYEVIASDFCGVGRPFATSHGALVAPSRRRDDWSARSNAATDTLSDADREALVSVWTRDGLFEHASVASFSRFALELMSVGAPPDLVAGAHRAALDEIEHARLCFALASRFANEPIGPGDFPIDSDGAVRTNLAEIAAATAAEGCVGETLAASIAAAQRNAATDPEVRAALYKIAEDESRHAELAWRAVAWAVRTGGPEVREAVAAVFANARSLMIPDASDVTLPSHGLLDSRERARVQMEVLTEVVGPCAAALLGDVA